MVRLIALVVLLLGTAVVTPSRSHAQTWRTVLTTAAVGSLWVDYAQIRYGIDHGSGTWVLGQQLTPASLVAVNALEAVVNVAAPRKWRPWVNALTLGFHVVAIYKTARRPIGSLITRTGGEVARIGFRLWW